MSRTISAAALAAMFAQETTEQFLTCLTIDHADLGAPFRLVDSTSNLVRTAGTFTAYPFLAQMPEDIDDRPPTVTITIDNVDRLLVPTIRSISTALSVKLEIVLESAPNTVLMGPMDFVCRSIPYDAESVQLVLAFEHDVLNELFPSVTFTPARFPALF